MKRDKNEEEDALPGVRQIFVRTLIVARELFHKDFFLLIGLAILLGALDVLFPLLALKGMMFIIAFLFLYSMLVLVRINSSISDAVSEMDQGKSQPSGKNYKVSVSCPKSLSKRFESIFLVQIYFPEGRSKVARNIKTEFGDDALSEIVQQSLVMYGQKIRVKLFSPAFDFPEAVTKIIDGPVNKITFLGMPIDSCEPGFHKVLISISDADTDQEFESFAISARVVDFAFDHVSRPMLSRFSVVVLSIGSFAMYILTFLEQIDKTVGLTSGTAAGILALGVYASFYALYQRVRPNTP